MSAPQFRSSLADAMKDLVAFKRLEGFDYTAQSAFLRDFDTFLCKQGYLQPGLNRNIVEAYIAHTAGLAPKSRHSRLSVVRVLSRYMQQFDSESYILTTLPFKRPSLPRWYLYTPDDISALLQHAQALRPVHSLRPHCFHMLIGLLAVTGLRIAEALALNLEDVDTTSALLHVRRGKFGKERYVPLAPSTITKIKVYLSRRAAHGSSDPKAPFFLTRCAKPLAYRQAALTFRRMIRHCRIARAAPKPPRLHDLRHTYACNCLLKWYEEGVDLNSRLSTLATALGHVNIEATQIYLHVTSRLLEHAAQRFHRTFAANC